MNALAGQGKEKSMNGCMVAQNVSGKEAAGTGAQ